MDATEISQRDDQVPHVRVQRDSTLPLPGVLIAFVALLGTCALLFVFSFVYPARRAAAIGASQHESFPDTRIDINNATAAELTLLPGIGPSLAHGIVTHREMLGGYRTLDQLDDVIGIGEKRIEKIRSFLTIDETVLVSGRE